MTEFSFAHKIANLEGLKNIALPSSCLDTSLSSLDQRAMRLELVFCVATPPPLSEPTWETLAYRLCRLDNKAHWTVLPETKTDLFDIGDEESRASALKRLLVKHFPALDSALFTETKKWDITATHYLCHEAGRLQKKIVKPPSTLMEIYCLAIQLSLQAERNFSGLVYNPHHRSVPNPPHVANHPRRNRGCCGCCDCSCHALDRLRSPTKKKKNRPGILQRLGRVFKNFTWRRSKFYDDTSSSSTEIVDDD